MNNNPKIMITIPINTSIILKFSVKREVSLNRASAVTRTRIKYGVANPIENKPSPIIKPNEFPYIDEMLKRLMKAGAAQGNAMKEYPNPIKKISSCFISSL